MREPINRPVNLGRFGHHPDPAIDFCIEVDCLEGLAHDVGCKLADRVEVSKRISSAMTFTVGGDAHAVAAKGRLRELELLLNLADHTRCPTCEGRRVHERLRGYRCPRCG